ncbi:proprotein convertase P-domain-containing protein [Vibrio atypicus]|uniref:proprotein convertase P-domain-containing protein n=1 Tax=Vibrio atypicus TaxID=558271 RepID=UPI00135AA023|nr:proprotein convertase P-domain-containing protein [Vibrio atypicus]
MKFSYSLIALSIFAQPALSGEWDYPAGNEALMDGAAAKAYIENHYADVGSVSLRYETKSKLGHQYNFDIAVAGDYKAQRTLVIHTDNDGLVQRVFKSLDDTIIRNGEATKAAELEAPRRLKAAHPPELSSGQLVTATVNIVDPDLRSMDRQAPPIGTWNDLSDYPNPARYVQRNVEVLQSGDQYYLSNSRVTQVDAEYLEEYNATSGQWQKSGSASFLAQEGIAKFADITALNQLSFASHDFTQVMAFYHIDESLRYVESLGYNLFDSPVLFDARGLSNNNSSYFYGPKAAMFGIGGSPDAIDADVVIHELGHGVHYQIVKDWAYGHTGAMGEGFADYWAGSASYRKLYQQGSKFEIDTVFNWDGYFGNRVTTRSLWNQRAKYFEQSEYRAHESVGGELGDELWSTPLFQTLKQAVEQYGKEAFAEVDTIVLESMYGLGRGMKMHDLVESMLFVADKLYPSRDYKQMLTANFELHGLLKAPFRLELDSRYVDDSKPISARLIANGRQASIEGQLETSNGAHLDLNEDKFSTSTQTLVLPDQETCGVPFELNADISYQYESNLKALNWKKSQTLILGVPEINQQVKVQNSVLPDASLANNGSFNAGFKSFNFIINDAGTATGDFGVYLKLNHSKMSDLQVELISPSGTRQMLLSNPLFSQPEKQFYWVAKHDDLIKPFVGQSLAGTWRLEVSDVAMGDSGQLVEWAVGQVERYSCGQATDNTNSNNTNNNSGSGGGAISWGLLLLSGLLFWRREQTHTH